MPTAVLDPFGNTIMACSISTAVKAKFGKDKFASEADWAKHVKSDAWNVLVAKIHNGELTKNTILARAPGNYKMKYEGTNFNGQHKVSVYTNAKNTDVYLLDQFKNTPEFALKDWDFGPNMAKMAEQQKLVVNTPAKLKKYIEEGNVDGGSLLAKAEDNYGGHYEFFYDYDNIITKLPTGGKLDMAPETFYNSIGQRGPNAGQWKKVEYKVGQDLPDLPVAHGLPVASTSTSKGALTNEDAATMFVKTKDKLAQEAGINIKGASGKLDELVYKTIADQAGYTPAEMLAKVEAYKGSGKKLSALKKKVLPKSGDSTKYATESAVNKATAAVKKETPKPEEVPQVWDSEVVAKAYVSAKDAIVAENNMGWTLYTKNPEFDAAILKRVQEKLGPIKAETMNTSLADYIANTQKLSVLKKQMIKKGELTPQADTLKKGGTKKASYNNVDEMHNAAKAGQIETGTTVVNLEDAAGQKYTITYEGQNAFGFPQYEFHYPSGPATKAAQSEVNDILKAKDYKHEFAEVKAAPKETGAGQVGKTTENPKVVGPKQQLTAEQEHDVFLQWEGLNLPISSSGQKIWSEAKNLAGKYGLGEDVLPILQAVDKGKTAKFGFSPEQNKKLYEQKVVEHLKNPHPPAYTPPAAAPHMEAKVFGEDPPDADLFKPVSPSEMHDIAIKGMKKPTPQESSHLRVYSGSTYHEINGHLRAGKSVETNIYAKSIQQSMSPLPADIISRRGTSLSGLGMQSQEQLTQSIGKTFVEPGFSSTAVGGSGQFGGQVNLVIQAPKGTQAVWLKPHSNISGENELLLAAGTKFKILKVEQKPGNWGSMTNVVTVRVIP